MHCHLSQYSFPNMCSKWFFNYYFVSLVSNHLFCWYVTEQHITYHVPCEVILSLCVLVFP